MNYCTFIAENSNPEYMKYVLKSTVKLRAYTRVSKHSIYPSISCLMNDSVQTNVHTNFLREDVWITALLCRKFKPWIYEILKSTVKSRAYTRVSKYSIFPLISCLMNDSVQTNVHTNFLRHELLHSFAEKSNSVSC